MPPTIKDVAREAGVGIGTVSRVFNNSPLVNKETRARVLAAAESMNYHPNASGRRLVQGRTQVIGFIERHAPQNFADAFMSEVLRGLHRAASEQQYHVLFEPFAPGEDTEERYLRLLREHHVDGIILSGPRFDDQRLLALYEQGIPIVLQGRLPGSAIPFVDVDNLQGARSATEHLIQLGHTQIGMITNAPLDYTAAVERKTGFEQALQQANLTIVEEWLAIGAFTPESGYNAAMSILRQTPRPTALFIGNDAVALGALEAARSLNLRIPQDLAIVGFDDIPWSAHFTPALSTVRLPAFDLGYNAGELLLAILKGHPPYPPQRLLPTTLIVRQSCGGAA